MVGIWFIISPPFLPLIHGFLGLNIWFPLTSGTDIAIDIRVGGIDVSKERGGVRGIGADGEVEGGEDSTFIADFGAIFGSCFVVLWLEVWIV
jgi:hypothetical protein